MRGKKYLAKQERLEWSRDLDLDSLISSNAWARLEELEKVVPFHLERFNEVIKKCTIFPLHDVPLVDLTFATRFLAVFLFLRVQGSRPMTFQFLTVTCFRAQKPVMALLIRNSLKPTLHILLTDFCLMI